MDSDPDDEAIVADEQEKIAILKQNISVYSLPLCHLASGRSSLTDKFFIVLYEIFLEAGLTLKCFARVVKEHVAGCTDMGVEFGLRQPLPVRCSKLFPWLPNSVVNPALPPARHSLESDDMLGAPVVADPVTDDADPEVSLHEMVSGIGLHGTLDSAC